MAAPAIVRELVDRFPLPGTASFVLLNETALRREFLDPLFRELGWDVENTRGAAHLYKEVIHEDKLQVQGSVRAPDYAFRIGGARKFFVEAKKPSVNLREDPHPAFQLRRYAWSANLPISILTDFQEFSIYDCRLEPSLTDHPDTARPMYLGYADYEARWDVIYQLFSKEAVVSGSLEQYAAQVASQRGTAKVDAVFLREMDSWRVMLANSIAQLNSNLGAPELSFAVQMILNRILFLRIAEDRGIEPYERLSLAVAGGQSYQELCTLFRDADDRYNSGLFHFHSERGRTSAADDLTLNISVDDTTLRNIVERLYYPSPYAFKMIPVEILGQVYEQFLGKVIRLSERGQVVVEEKPELRRAGGIYYTPDHIVEFIIRSTLEKLLVNKTPRSVASLRIIDPACGSGSFLVSAYRYLLEWHRQWYIKDGLAKHKQVVYEDINGDWQLSTTERKRILRNCIFGVDLDSHAVEVTKLSLLLVVLEGATENSIATQLRFAQERALPDLDNNIKCGNSLIEPDYQSSAPATSYDQVRPFQWANEFREVMLGGGFDAVIGNPPYIDIVGIPMWQRRYFTEKYRTFLYRSDILGVFFERAIQLLRPHGRIGFITSNTYFTSTSAAKLRALMLETLSLDHIVNLGGGVFSQATVDTAIFTATKGSVPDNVIHLATCKDLAQFRELSRGEASGSTSYSIQQADFGTDTDSTFLITSGASTEALVGRIRATAEAVLDDVMEIARGYIAYDAHRGHSTEMIEGRVFHAEQKVSGEYKKELVGSDIGRYYLNIKSKLWIRFGRNLAAPRHDRFHHGPRIWIQRIRNPKLVQRLVCFYTSDNEDLAASSGLSIGRCTDERYSAAALCGLLNSRLINWWYAQLFHDVNIKPADMATIPVPLKWLQFQDKVAEMALNLQQLYRQLDAEKMPIGKTLCQRQIEATDTQIDRLIYDLYGLTTNEIALVEGSEVTRASVPA